MFLEMLYSFLPLDILLTFWFNEINYLKVRKKFYHFIKKYDDISLS